jgi:hypothetical protein
MHGIAEVSGLVKLCLKIKAYGPHGDGGQVNRKSASLPTWPFDIQVVSRFITLVLSVEARVQT